MDYNHSITVFSLSFFSLALQMKKKTIHYSCNFYIIRAQYFCLLGAFPCKNAFIGVVAIAVVLLYCCCTVHGIYLLYIRIFLLNENKSASLTNFFSLLVLNVENYSFLRLTCNEHFVCVCVRPSECVYSLYIFFLHLFV